MNTRGWILTAATLIASAAAIGSTAQPVDVRVARRDAPVEPVVVELFTAQGCKTCPEANRVVEALADEPGIIALTYAVDYWDYLGWPDTFARPEFAQRQRAYRGPLRLRNVYTPQIVIDGRRQVSGARAGQVQVAVDEEAERRVFPPEIEFRESGDAVGIGSGRTPIGGAEVWAVTYRPGTQMVEVAGGENRGQTVRHMNVVRQINKLGDWTGLPILYPLPTDVQDGEAIAVFVQGKISQRIVAAAQSGSED